MFAVRESQLVEVALNPIDWSVVPIAVSEVTPVDSVVGSVVNRSHFHVLNVFWAFHTFQNQHGFA